MHFWPLLFTFSINAQDNFKMFIPEYIPVGGSFEISLISSKSFSEAEKLDIYLLPDFSLAIDRIELKTDIRESKIPVTNEFLDDYSEIYKKVSVDLTDSITFSPESFFQLIIHLNSDRINLNSMKIYGEFIANGEVIANLENVDDNLMSIRPNLYNLVFNYFEKYPTAELAASFMQNYYLNIPLVYDFDEILVAEFWLKSENLNSSFLEIVNGETNRVEYYLSINENQILLINSRSDEVLQKNPFFISSNCWYHINIIFDKSKSEILILSNGSEFSNIKSHNYLAYNNLLLHFGNDKSSGVFNIDQFRLISLNDSISGITNNRNYPEYLDENSQVVFQINFSDDETINLFERKIISYERLKLVKSDAPIYPRAPEVDVKLLSNFFEITWKGGDLRNAYQYILERAIGNGGFKEVGREAANSFEEKEYSLITEIPQQPEIVYFRIKQINKDGSKITSDVVKIGQGTVEDVMLGQNYPNPFNPKTVIEFELLQDTEVEVKVFNLAGKEVALLHEGFLNKGIYQFEFDAEGLSSGIYVYQVNTPFSSQTRKMIFAK